MPELAEVEFGRKVASRVCVGRRIRGVVCDNDAIVFDGVSPDAVRQALLGARVEAVCRKGKQLWFELDRRPWPLFHFGMTGAFHTPGGRSLALASTPLGGEPVAWPPRFCKIRLTLDNGGQLAMTNKRRLGRIRLRQRPLQEPPLSRLGFDPLTEMPDARRFWRVLHARKTRLKPLLLNQSFSAGVGNWLADEVCFQAALDPRIRARELTELEAERIRTTLARIVAQAVAVDADKARFPQHWLFHRRWGKVQGATTLEGAPIEFLTLAGRTTAWVPSLQRDARGEA